jgi:CDP-glucose 4,6-dehydratase
VIRSNGTLVRDFIYVEDAVEAYLTLAEKLGERPELAGRAFNFSTETPLTVRAIVDKILQLMGSDLEPVVVNEANNEIAEQFLDASSARQELSWKALFGHDEGLRRTIAWYRDYFGSLPNPSGI